MHPHSKAGKCNLVFGEDTAMVKVIETAEKTIVGRARGHFFSAELIKEYIAKD